MNTLLPGVAVNPINKDDGKPERFVISQGEDVFLIVTDDEQGDTRYDLALVTHAKYTESSVMNGAVVDRAHYLILVYKNKPSVFLKGQVAEVKETAALINHLSGKIIVVSN